MNDISMEIFRANQVNKTYKTSIFNEGITALHEATLDLNRGECCGLVGPNGAGKSTFIKIIVGIERSNGGIINISKEIGAIGYVPEKPAFYESMSAFNNLLYFAKLAGINNPSERVNKLLDDFGLSSRKEDEVSGFSKGMRQRLAIARALIHRPGLLFLDEPFSGLDPSMTIDLKERLISMKRMGITMLISSHNLAEVQAICDNVAFMKDGNIVKKVSTKQMNETAIVRFKIINKYHPSLQISKKIITQVIGSYYDFNIARAEIPDLVSAIVMDGAKIEGVEFVENDIETLYRSIFKEEEHVSK